MHQQAESDHSPGPPKGSDDSPPVAPGQAGEGHHALPDAENLRADTYRLLARLLRAAPDRDLLRDLSALSRPDLSASRTSTLEAAWRGLSEAAGRTDPASADEEYHDLFIGLSRGELLPYASWYLAGFLMDKPLATLRDDLARLGVARGQGVKEPEDHAAALCETMALLADPEDGVDTATQRDFFKTHLRTWLPRFFQDVQNAKSAEFYRPVGRLGAAFMEFEQTWLALPE